MLLWLCHTGRGWQSVWVCFPSVRHSAFRVIGWFEPPCFFTSTSLACQARGSRSSASVPLVFIRLLSESPLSLSLSTCYISFLHPLPRLSSRLSIFPLSVLFLSGPSISPSFCRSIFSPPGLTVWKVDESDCMWQSGMRVNLMWLIWWLLTALWKLFTLKEHWDMATLWPSYPQSPCCCWCDCVGGCMCLLLQVCVCVCVCVCV